ncbi:MAG: adenylosuccinate synthase [Bdellovibrionaceae bacterium]|nr:adenylosuccinate synthase [Pseudobdellovibrionaceae bacterium]
MSITVVVGAQWGDEGKGKLIDVFATHADTIVRFQGGSNAGHTLVVKGKKTVLHLVPSGILHPDKTCVITSSVVVDIFGLLAELKKLKDAGITISANQLMISDRATVLLQYHKNLDQARELSLSNNKSKEKIGTTGKGIGPAYEDRAARTALIMSDLFDHETLLEKLEHGIKEKNFLLKHMYDQPEVDVNDLHKQILAVVDQLQPFRKADTSLYIDQQRKEGKKILFEGAQGTLLDINHGTYPYVTSSNTLAGSGSTSAGVGPQHLSKIVGVFKAYCTRVGSGPFPTELQNDIGARLQIEGHEFGSTTGRVRRCGWLDLVALKYAIRLNGINSLALMKLDVLSCLDEIQVCTGYKMGNEILTEFPTDTSQLKNLEPILEKFAGWKTDITKVSTPTDLPKNAIDYIHFIQKTLACPIDVISVGPDREQTLWVKPLYKD